VSVVSRAYTIVFKVFKQSLAYLLLSIFALEAIVPLGYMPSKLSQGQWVDICPVQQASLASLLQTSHHHHHHDSNDNESSISAKSVCDWGSGIQSVFITAYSLDVVLGILPQSLPFTEKTFISRSTYRYSGNRDPPQILA
tara:strand:+ start:423 stop:842 length:420 start_codon:yes stop_codon:yes gene_type:complete